MYCWFMREIKYKRGIMVIYIGLEKQKIFFVYLKCEGQLKIYFKRKFEE